MISVTIFYSFGVFIAGNMWRCYNAVIVLNSFNFYGKSFL